MYILKKYHLFVFILLFVGLSACGEKVDEPINDNELKSTPVTSRSSNSSSSTIPEGVNIEAGTLIYNGLCFACHGADGKGVEGLGKDLINSDIVLGSTDLELVAFIMAGRDIADPNNTTGVAMPPSGGNPALTEDNIASVVIFLRELISNVN
jgi:cytochrome c5